MSIYNIILYIYIYIYIYIYNYKIYMSVYKSIEICMPCTNVKINV